MILEMKIAGIKSGAEYNAWHPLQESWLINLGQLDFNVIGLMLVLLIKVVQTVIGSMYITPLSTM